MKVRLVTGHVHLPSAEFYRSKTDFANYSNRLLKAPVEKSVFAEWPLDKCWLYPHVHSEFGLLDIQEGRPVPYVPISTQGNPAKDTVDYMVVLAQKTKWLQMAWLQDDPADVYVWMDYGIFHQEGFTEELVADFFNRVRPHDLAFPGLWDKAPVPETEPCWRFLGSMFVCPAEHVANLHDEVRSEILRHLTETSHVLWDVNNWARVELLDKLPIRWYGAGHNSSMLTNY
jgi:hypothetical protein